jgi:DNA-binding response OmpR family regulator
MRTLVVEDDAISAFALSDELELAGHAVVGPARSSGEAFALVRAQHPKLALIGVNLETDGAGVRLAQKLSQDFEMPVVFITADAEVARAHAEYALGVIVKPFAASHVAEILKYVQALLVGDYAAPPACPGFEPFH